MLSLPTNTETPSAPRGAKAPALSALANLASADDKAAVPSARPWPMSVPTP